MTKLITCKEFEKIVRNYWEEKLDFIQKERFNQHAKTCPKCNKLSDKCFTEKMKEDFVGMLTREQGHCLLPSTMMEYEKGELTLEEVGKFKAHTAVCSLCEGLVRAAIKIADAEKLRERASVINQIEGWIKQLKEKILQNPLLHPIFYPREGRIRLSDWPTPSFASSHLSSGETIPAMTKKIEIPHHLKKYFKEAEVTLEKTKTGWAIQLDFMPLSELSEFHKPFLVMLRGKGFKKKKEYIKFNTVRFEISSQISSWEKIWIQI